MIIPYPNNQLGDFLVSYVRTKTGPNWFCVYYKNVATSCLTTKQVKQTFGKARFTDSIKRLGEWCDDMITTYDSVGIEIPESTSILDPTDPNHNTPVII